MHRKCRSCQRTRNGRFYYTLQSASLAAQLARKTKTKRNEGSDVQRLAEVTAGWPPAFVRYLVGGNTHETELLTRLAACMRDACVRAWCDEHRSFGSESLNSSSPALAALRFTSARGRGAHYKARPLITAY